LSHESDLALSSTDLMAFFVPDKVAFGAITTVTGELIKMAKSRAARVFPLPGCCRSLYSYQT